MICGNQFVMRSSIVTRCILAFALIVLFYVALSFVSKNNYLASFSSSVKTNEKRTASNSSVESKTRGFRSAINYSSEEIDEIQRIKSIVDKLPELKLPTNLKYGFELMTPIRSDQSILPSMQPAEAETSYHKYIKSLQIKCPKKTRIGRRQDGGWDACIAGPFNLREPCLAYSIGIGNEWSFDYMITTKHKCVDMAYDPTIGKGDGQPRDRLWFYNAGLGYCNERTSRNRTMKTFGQMINDNQHNNRTIDILKIDIEYNEWKSLETILREESLRNVKQLMVEFHTMELFSRKPSSSKNYAYYWQILRGLDKIGFKIWHYLDTPSGFYKSAHTGKRLSCCANVYFINTALLN